MQWFQCVVASGGPALAVLDRCAIMMRCVKIRHQGSLVQITATGVGHVEVYGAKEVVLRGRLFGLWETRSAGGSAFTRREA